MLQNLNKHIVDLHHSEWDKEASDPKTGNYVFTNKLYVNYYDKGRRPAWHFTWILNKPEHRNMVKIDQGYEPVKVNDPTCMYWPEGMVPDAQGEYVYGDVVFSRCPLIKYLKQMEYEKKLSERGFRDVANQFKTEAQAAGAEITESDIDKLAKQYIG